MEKLTPGRKLILDLLAKSVAKIQAGDAEREVKKNDAKLDGSKGTKQESFEVGMKKKIKAENETNHLKKVKVEKEEHGVVTKSEGIKTGGIKKKKRAKKENEDELPQRSEEVKLNNMKKVIKSEYVEMKAEDIDLESYGERDSKENVNANIGRNGNKKDSIKMEDLDAKSVIKSDIFEQANVLKVEPVSQSLKKEHLVGETDLTLEGEHSSCLNKLNVDENRRHNFSERKSSAGRSCRRFSAEEEGIILDAIEKFGDKINLSQLAKDLKRTERSIYYKVRNLKGGKEIKKKFKMFTLLEDLMILEAVLKKLGEESLEVVNLTPSEWEQVGNENGRGDSSRTRWTRKLRPWLLQHFAGTLNLETRRPLANYVAENFTDITSIDWTSVTKKPEFAGHTNISLRYKYSKLLLGAKRNYSKVVEKLLLKWLPSLLILNMPQEEERFLTES